MMHYRKIWEIANNKKIPDDYEIHHIDGNHQNNDISNLKLVSIEEHLEIHRSQEDWGAVQAILIRMSDMNKEEISKAASKKQKELFVEGKHNFQKTNKTEIGKKIIEERTKLGLPAFLNIKDTIENSRNAGKVSAQKKAGFLNTDSEKHGSKKIKGTFWWTNELGQRVRSIESPGENWAKGMITKEKNEG
jgi:bacterioferritin (cytochrome b1)